ncbi:sigma-70 family RNA polymerase sigma factor [Thermoactinospora rubra]|uniref:sigma-70 family RNA polymerase sigma factor n=1 Tax=Thermoactinospora rubra TaxID=1088767 RepID=UPI000A109A47|nr:sigma-70 family RNA polymerase sigma factor [Thermoactinospora rubra]
MNDRVLVEALRAHDPGALAALYDSHAESIYRYCWSLLLSSDSAQVALRETLIAAEAHIRRLADPGRLRTWLFALARTECLRRRQAVAPEDATAELPAVGDPEDADLRVMAWNAVRGLAEEDRELLELATVHRLPAAEIAAVLGTSPRRVEPALEEARERLRDAITAEVLARKGPYDCPRRALILSGFSGELTDDMRAHLVRHVARCEICAPHRSRQVSAAKVFELLPAVGLPESLRVRVLSCFIDPELTPYRRYVARRSAALDAAGFPVAGDRPARRRPRALAGAVAAVAAVIAIVGAFHFFRPEPGALPGIASGALPAQGDPPGIRLPWQPAPEEHAFQVEPIADRPQAPPVTSSARPWEIAAEARDAHGTTGPSRAPATNAPRTPAQQEPEGQDEPGSGPVLTPQDPPRRDHHGRPTRTPCPSGKPGPTGKPRPSGKPTPAPSPTPTPTSAPTPAPTGTPTSAPSSAPSQSS